MLFSWFSTTAWSSLSGGHYSDVTSPRTTRTTHQKYFPLGPGVVTFNASTQDAEVLRSAWSTKQVLGLPTRHQSFTVRPHEQDTAAHCPALKYSAVQGQHHNKTSLQNTECTGLGDNTKYGQSHLLKVDNRHCHFKAVWTTECNTDDSLGNIEILSRNKNKIELDMAQ